MYRVTHPPLRSIETISSSVSLVKSPRETAQSLSVDKSLSAGQLQSELSQIRRIQKDLANRASRPPEPGWKAAMTQASKSLSHLERMMVFFQAQPTSPAKSRESDSYLAELSVGQALQNSGRTPDTPPSAAEYPTVSPSASKAKPADSSTKETMDRLTQLAEQAAQVSDQNRGSAVSSTGSTSTGSTSTVSASSPVEPTARPHEPTQTRSGTSYSPLAQQVILHQAEIHDLQGQKNQQNALHGLVALAETAAASRHSYHAP